MSNHRVLYKDENFNAVLEEKDSILFLHCEVDNFSKSVFKQMQVVLEEIKVACLSHGWEELFSYTPNPKFGKMLGGEKIDEFEYMNKHYEVLRWEL